MKIMDGLLKLLCLAVCLGLSAALPSLAQNSPPTPPTPPAPPPPVKRIGPTFRPVPVRADLEAKKTLLAAVPDVPVPLVNPQPAAPGVAPLPVASATPAANPSALVFDAEQKDYTAKAGEASASFTFNLTNVSSAEVLVNRVTTSCGCTVAKLPEQPWHLAPGTNGPIGVTVDLRGKSGTIMKSVTVDSTAGVKSLLVKVTIPPPQAIATASPMDRTRNLAMAQADSKAIFKSDCAECHVKPALGKMGKELYAGACAVCHDAEHRATMVPDLHVFKHPETRDYWTYTISEGKANSLMPGFAQKSGGILSEQQIASLVDYMTTGFAKDTNSAPHTTSLSTPAPAPQSRPAPQPNGPPTAALGPFQIR